MDKEKKSAWKEFCESIQFFIDSKKGKYSLETYLEIVGEYTDRLIIEAEGTGMNYSGGECTVKKKPDENVYEFNVKIHFTGIDDVPICKEAVRKIPIDKFTRETTDQIGAGEIKFRIDKPERGRS